MSVNLSIKSVPEALAQRLRERAARNRRSLQRELLSIIEEAAYAEDAPQPVGRLFRGAAGHVESPKSIDEIVESLRARFPDPRPDLPLGVDILRSDRDSR